MTSTASASAPSRLPAAVAGLLAGALGLGLSELIAGLISGAASLVTAIGGLIIQLQPPGAKQFVVDLFGDADKLVLNLAVVIVALGLASGLGIVARTRWLLAAGGFVLIGVLAFGASLLDSLNDPTLTALNAGVSVTAAVLAMRWLLRAAADRRPPEAEMLDFDRRRFLGGAIGFAAVAATSGALGRFLLERRAAAVASVPPVPEPGSTAPPLPSGASLDVDGIAPIVTPNETFYRIDTALLTPRIEASDWELTVNGMVDEPFSLTYQELLAFPQVEQYVTIACVSNEVGGRLVGNAKWQGARLNDLLARAGVQDGATQIVGRAGHDDWTAGFPTSWLDNPEREALVAVAMNDEPLPPEHGYPARLIVPGLYGYVSATKWLTNIELTTMDFDAYWVPRGWAKEAPILTQSRIDRPRRGERGLEGTVPIAGVAWAPDRGVSRVEVQIDDGDWQEAEISTPISDATWVQFVYRWQSSPGDHVIRVRATDGTGAVQTAEETRPAPDGARGHHTIRVTAG